MTTKNDKTWSHELEVVGLGFRLKRETRRQLRRMVESKGSIAGIQIEREPENRFDFNAIKVSLPSRVFSGAPIGYFHRETAEMLASRMDAGTLVVKSAVLTDIHGDDDKQATVLVRFIDKPAKGD